MEPTIMGTICAETALDEGYSIELDQKFASLIEMFPDKRFSEIREALNMFSGSLYWTIDYLIGTSEIVILDSTRATEVKSIREHQYLQKIAANPRADNSLDVESISQTIKAIPKTEEEQLVKQSQENLPLHSSTKLRTACSKTDWTASLAATDSLSESRSAIGFISSNKNTKEPSRNSLFPSGYLYSPTKDIKAEAPMGPKYGAPSLLPISTKAQSQKSNVTVFKQTHNAYDSRSQLIEVIDLTDDNVRQPIQVQTVEEKIKDLMTTIIGSTYQQCAAALEANENNLTKAYRALSRKVGQGFIRRLSFQHEPDPCEESYATGDNNHSARISGKGKGAVVNTSLKLTSSRKRRSYKQGNRTIKKPCLDAEKKIDTEELSVAVSAREWVLNTFPETSEIEVELADGIHPCTFQKSALKDFRSLNDMIKEDLLKLKSGLQRIKLPDVKRDSWDLALQWTSTKTLGLSSQLYSSTAAKITALLELAFAEISLGLADFNADIVGHLKKELKANRGALEGKHIRRTFQLPNDSPIRQIIVKAALRLYFVYHNPNFSPQHEKGDSPSEHRDAAHRAAVFGNQYIFQAELDSIPDFELAMLREMRAVMVTRQVLERQNGRTTWVFYKDPLTEESFKLCSC